jgi:predicted DNA-binding transcriptional regulator YafY
MIRASFGLETTVARFERVDEIYDRLCATREPQSLDSLCAALGTSPATVKRLIRFLRDRGTPIEFDRENGGYVLDRENGAGAPLIGPQFRAKELSAMLTAYELLAQIPPGAFKRETASLRSQLEALLYRKPTGSQQIRKRVRLLLPQLRPLQEDTFRTVLAGLNGQKRVRIGYRSRYKDEDSLRTVSPLRLTFYRSNWYLAGWCHRSNDLRIFSMDRIARAELTPVPNQEIADQALDARLGTAYGIFEGQADKLAKLKFTSESARWIADELWHPDQRLETRLDGSVVLHVPYRHAKELVMDVLRYGPAVEVLGPAALRKEVASALAAAAAMYGAGPDAEISKAS